MRTIRLLLVLTFTSFSGFILKAQVPQPALVGYWHNWNSVNAPYIQLDDVDSSYNVVILAFAIPHAGTDYQMEFIPDVVSQSTLISQIQTLQAQGRKVLISVGGATAPVTLSDTIERNVFVSTMTGILNTYGFDGMDIDLEGSSLSVSGGTIAAPVDQPVIHLINAIKKIMANFYTQHGNRMILTFAPETAFVQGGMSAYGGIWGAYLPVIHALRDSIAILHVQLYNSGTMYGIDANIYSQGTADFIVAMTEAVIQGFNTTGGIFNGLPASKVAVGLPACTSAAGGGYTPPDTVAAAMKYLLGIGPKPGHYTLTQPGGYPGLRGMMTWSINWDAVSTCGPVYEFADNFENIFGMITEIEEDPGIQSGISVYPNPFSDEITVTGNSFQTGLLIRISDLSGRVFFHSTLSNVRQTFKIGDLAPGVYVLSVNHENHLLLKAE